MLNATLDPNDLHNSAIFQETVNVYLSGHNSDCGMLPKHPEIAIYLRASHNKQDDSIATQISALRDTVRIRTGFDIDDCALYIDDGMSARKYPHFYDRKTKKSSNKQTGGGAKMWEDIQAGKINQIFAFAAKRFFRKVHAGAAWIDVMVRKYPHVDITSLDCPFDHRTAKGGAMWNLFFTLAEMENEERAEATKAGTQRNQEQLGRSSHAIFGWEWNEEDEKMQPNWHQQAVIRHIKESWNDNKGQSYNAVAKDLNRWGIKTSTGRDWNAGSIRRSIHTPPKMQQQLHQFNEPKRMITAPFRGYKA